MSKKIRKNPGALMILANSKKPKMPSRWIKQLKKKYPELTTKQITSIKSDIYKKMKRRTNPKTVKMGKTDWSKYKGRPPKEWFYYIVKEIKKKRPKIKDPQALAGWLWFHQMKPETREKVLIAVKAGRAAGIIRQLSASMIAKGKIAANPKKRSKLEKMSEEEFQESLDILSRGQAEGRVLKELLGEEGKDLELEYRGVDYGRGEPEKCLTCGHSEEYHDLAVGRCLKPGCDCKELYCQVGKYRCMVCKRPASHEVMVGKKGYRGLCPYHYRHPPELKDVCAICGKPGWHIKHGRVFCEEHYSEEIKTSTCEICGGPGYELRDDRVLCFEHFIEKKTNPKIKKIWDRMKNKILTNRRKRKNPFSNSCKGLRNPNLYGRGRKYNPADTDDFHRWLIYHKPYQAALDTPNISDERLNRALELAREQYERERKYNPADAENLAKSWLKEVFTSVPEDRYNTIKWYKGKINSISKLERDAAEIFGKEIRKCVFSDRVRRNPNLIEIVAKQSGLSRDKEKAFYDFMARRFPGENDIYYLRKWARRFKEGYEWAHADYDSRKILQKIAPNIYPKSVKIDEKISGVGVKQYLYNPQLKIKGMPSGVSPSIRQQLNEAIALYKKRHGVSPISIVKVKVPQGYPKVGVPMGNVPEIMYKTAKHINPRAKVPNQMYRHKFEGKTVLVTNPKGKGLFIVPKKPVTYKRWITG